MQRFLFALAIAAIATTGLMADKCSTGDTINGNQKPDTTQEQPAE